MTPEERTRRWASDWRAFTARHGNIALSQNLGPAQGATSSGGDNVPPSGPSLLSQFLDTITRPLHGTMLATSRNLDRVAESAKSQAERMRSGEGFSYSEAAKALSRLASPILNAPEFIEGMTTEDESQKKLGVDLIDQVGGHIADARGEEYEKPKFRENPGASIARGVGGFALDVAMDPITYLPLGPIVSALRGGVRGAKGARAGKEAVEEVIEAATEQGARRGAPTARPLDDVAPSRQAADVATPAPAVAREVAETAADGGARIVSGGTSAGAEVARQSGRLRQVAQATEGAGGVLSSLLSSAGRAARSSGPVPNVTAWMRQYNAASPRGTDNLAFHFGEHQVSGSQVIETLERIARTGRQGVTAPVDLELIRSFRQSKPGQDFLKALRQADQGMSDEAANAIRQILGRVDSQEYQMLRTALGSNILEEITRLPLREQGEALGAIRQLAANPEAITRETAETFPDVVRRFMNETLNLTPEAFSRSVEDALTGSPRAVQLVAEARRADLDDLSKLLGETPGTLMNDADEVYRSLAKRFFDGDVSKARKKYQVIDGQLNQYGTATTVAASIDLLNKELRRSLGRRPRWRERISAIRDGLDVGGRRVPSVVDNLKRLESIAFESGRFLGVRIGRGAKTKELPLLPSSIYDAARLLNAEQGRQLTELVERMLYNTGTAPRFTQLLEGVALHLMGESDDVVRQALRKNLKGNPLAEKGGLYGFTRLQKGQKMPASPGNGITYEMASNGSGYYTRYSATKLTDEAIELIKGIGPAVKQASELYTAAHVQKGVRDAGELLARTEALLAEAFNLGDGAAINQLADTVDNLVDSARSMGASAFAVETATKRIAEDLPRGIVSQAERVKQAQARIADDARKGRSAEEIMDRARRRDSGNNQTFINALKDADALVDDVIREHGREAAERLYGVGNGVELAALRSQTAMARMVDWFGDTFNARSRTSVDGVDIYEAFRQNISVAGKDINVIQQQIFDVARRHQIRIGTSQETNLSAAFKLLQRGERTAPANVEGAEGINAALRELEPLVQKFFDVNGQGISGDFFWRNSQNHRYIDEAWEYYDMGRYAKEPFLEAFGKGDPAQAWRSWKIDNSGEFLTRYNLVVHRALGAKLTAQSMDRQLLTWGLASRKAKPGFARPEKQGKSFMFAGLEESQLYYDRRVLDAISEIEHRLHTSRQFQGAPGKFVDEFFDPATRAWKTGVTIYRPGHHVRNIISNGGLSFMAEGPRNLARSGVIAARLLSRRRGHKTVQGADGLPKSDVEALLTGERLSMTGGEDIAFSVTAQGGKKIEVSFDALHRAVTERGLLRTFQQAEDLVRDATGGIGNRMADAALMTHTRFGRGLGNFSEALDHHGITQQAIQFAMNNMSKVGSRRFPTIDSVWDEAAKRAYRFHPDASSLTPFEAKYMRRLIPFYTWFRGTLPAILEASWQYPGRMVAFHKASFNAAQSFGIDAESYANPFPEDEMVPDFLRERVFGVNFVNPLNGQKFAMNPGFAHTDLFSDFFGGARTEFEDGSLQHPASSLLSNAANFLKSSTTPFISLPYELLSGKGFVDGKEIPDMSENVDSYLPNVQFLSRLLGNSVTGSIVKGGADPLRGVESGWQTPLFDEQGHFSPGRTQGMAMYNWFTGQAGVPVGEPETGPGGGLSIYELIKQLEEEGVESDQGRPQISLEELLQRRQGQR